jgi:hypothetical protein
VEMILGLLQLRSMIPGSICSIVQELFEVGKTCFRDSVRGAGM